MTDIKRGIIDIDKYDLTKPNIKSMFLTKKRTCPMLEVFESDSDIDSILSKYEVEESELTKLVSRIPDFNSMLLAKKRTNLGVEVFEPKSNIDDSILSRCTSEIAEFARIVRELPDLSE